MRLKPFLQGAVSTAICVMAVAGIVITQYSDYRAATETSSWLNDVLPTVRTISANIIHIKGTTGSGIGVPNPVFKFHAPSVVEITANGTLFLKGGRDGQFVALIPEYSSNHVSWRCMGGSSQCHAGMR